MGTPYNLLFPSHEAPRLSAPIAVTSDAKWQDKSYQRDKIKLTQMLLIEMEWSQLLSSFPFIFSILSKNAAPRGTNRRSLNIQGRKFYFFNAKVVHLGARLRHSKKSFRFLRDFNLKKIPVLHITISRNIMGLPLNKIRFFQFYISF